MEIAFCDCGHGKRSELDNLFSKTEATSAIMLHLLL